MPYTEFWFSDSGCKQGPARFSISYTLRTFLLGYAPERSPIRSVHSLFFADDLGLTQVAQRDFTNCPGIISIPLSLKRCLTQSKENAGQKGGVSSRVAWLDVGGGSVPG